MLGSVFGGILGALEVLLLCSAVLATYGLTRRAAQRSQSPERTLRLTGLAVLGVSLVLAVLLGAGQRLRLFVYFLTLLGVPAGLGLVPPPKIVALLNRLVGSAEHGTPE